MLISENKIYYDRRKYPKTKRTTVVKILKGQEVDILSLKTIPKYQYHFFGMEKVSLVFSSLKDTNLIASREIKMESQPLLSHLIKRWRLPSFLAHIIDIHLYLLSSLELLSTVQKTHGNIQMDSILYSEEMECPLLGHFKSGTLIQDNADLAQCMLQGLPDTKDEDIQRYATWLQSRKGETPFETRLSLEEF